ncbi:MAG: hypothetical protein ABEI54_01900 [Candidatus Bipolaricaulia bacterium]
MPDEKGFVTEDDITVKRNEKGEVLPQTVKTNVGKMRMTPLPYGTAEEFQDTLEAGGDADTEEAYKILKDNVEKPKIEDIYPSVDDFRQNIKAGVPIVMLQKIMEISGIAGTVEATEEGEIEVKGADTGN